DGTFDDNTEQIVPNSWYRDDPHMTQSDISLTIPQIDGRYYVGGQHRMRIVLVQDARNRKACQNTGYGEVRDYTVNIIPKEISSDAQDPYVFETNCRDARYVGIWIDFNNDGTFDDNTEQIVPNSWYRDDPHMTQSDISLTIPQIDGRYYVGGQHRMRIVLVQDARNRKACQNTGYGEVRDYTVNIIPKEISSDAQDPYVFEANCRDARYVGVWIDFNDDGTFDDNTEQIVPNSWYRDDPHMTQSDIGFIIPQLDGRHYVGGQHRMRIVLVQDARNRKGCQNTGYGEVRDYTVQIIETRTY
ncbi:unnamed protein product, partial [Rotaria sp. Silwood1]